MKKKNDGPEEIERDYVAMPQDRILGGGSGKFFLDYGF